MWPFDLLGSDEEQQTGLSGDERVNLLGSLGAKWVSGNGDNAVWQLPNGTRMQESALIDQVQGTYDKPAGVEPAKTPTGSVDNSPNVGINPATGRPEYFTLSGGKAVFAGVEPQAPAGSGGSGNALGWAQLEQTKKNAEEATRQFDVTTNAKLAQNATDSTLARELFEWNKNKEAYANTQDNVKMATQAKQFQQEYGLKLSGLEMQKQQMISQREQFNAQMQMTVQKANMEYQAQARQELNQAGRDIAEYASHPTDYGKLAAYLTANQKFGGAANEITGKDFTSDTSLAPLGQGLQAAQSAKARSSQSPYSFAPLGLGQTAANSSTYDPNAVAHNQNVAAGVRDDITNPAYAGIAAGNPYAQINAIARTQGMTNPDTNFANFNEKGNAQPGVGGFALGGMPQGAYISGDAPGDDPSAGGARPELNIPVANGKAIVLNEKQMEALGINLKRIMKMADGGVFASGEAFTAPDTTDPKQFLNESLGRALKPLPASWGVNGRDSLPSATFASSPGTSPIVTQLLGGLSAMAGLLPADEYARQAALITPMGVREQGVRRSA